MTRFALLLANDGEYYVRNEALIQHVRDLTYKLKKTGLLAQLICFNQKRELLNELRDNIKANRPSLSIGNAQTAAVNVIEDPVRRFKKKMKFSQDTAKPSHSLEPLDEEIENIPPTNTENNSLVHGTTNVETGLHDGDGDDHRKNSETFDFQILAHDVNALSTYLQSKMDHYSKSLLESFTRETWQALAEVTLVFTLVVNQTRPKELERMLKRDYERYEQLPGKSGSSDEQCGRFRILGKYQILVPITLNEQMKKCFDLLLKHSGNAGIDPKNPYFFGIPSGKKRDFRFLRSRVLLEKFASECGANQPELLRPKNLRKYETMKWMNKKTKQEENPAADSDTQSPMKTG